MIDPITIGAAFVVAKTSVAYVKEAINLGHEIKDCYDELSKFFKAQGEIEKAANEAEAAKNAPVPKEPEAAKAHQTALEQAFTIVMQRKQMREFERELKDMFTMKGELALYQELCDERQRIIGAENDARREAIRQARLEKDIAERKAKEQQETIELATVVFFLMVAVGAILWFLIEVM
jgi:hypothetical protein